MSVQGIYPSLAYLQMSDPRVLAAQHGREPDHNSVSADTGGVYPSLASLQMSNSKISTDALHAALRSGNADLVAASIRGGADVNAEMQGNGEKNPLHYTAISGPGRSFLLLLNAGANVNARDASGHTPFPALVNSCQMDLIQAFLKKNPRLTQADLDYCRTMPGVRENQGMLSFLAQLRPTA